MSGTSLEKSATEPSSKVLYTFSIPEEYEENFNPEG
jgi:hypothetical protein